MSELTVAAIPIFAMSMALEAYVLYRSPTAYKAADTLTSLSGGVGSVLMNALVQPVRFAIYTMLYSHRIADLGTGVLGAIALLFAEDFCFYAYHRTCHSTRFFWAAHQVHHSSESYNLSTALRQSWTAPIVGMLFWLPLAVLGFRPEQVMLASSISLLYQYVLHTETVRTLGPLELLMNTPSHHRVHHGSNTQYLDRNHGGIFILWDRLFGTFEPEVAPPVYGLTKPVASFNPVYVQLCEFQKIFWDVVESRSLASGFHAVFRSPSYQGPAPEIAPQPTVAI